MKTLYQTKLNKLILLVHGITTFFLTMGLMAQLMSSGLPPMKSVPQIVLNLLVFIGGKMLIEGLHPGEDEEQTKTTLGLYVLFIQGIATSIDALSVGFTISDYNWVIALVCALIIALVTFFICVAGVMIGKQFGTKLANKASVLGGVILIAIGVEIFVSGVF